MDTDPSPVVGNRPAAVPPNTHQALPPVVAEEQWAARLRELLPIEKSATHLLDAIAAARRELPMHELVDVPDVHSLDGARRTLLDLFEGRRQLLLYHLMYAPEWETACSGCSRRMDDVGHLAHLHARDTTFAVVARAPRERLRDLWADKGWHMPCYSSYGTGFNQRFGVTDDEGGEDFAITALVRDDDGRVFRTYRTTGRGVEPAGFRHLLDLTAYGRQEDWETSPPGWPQSPTHGWGSERDR